MRNELLVSITAFHLEISEVLHISCSSLETEVSLEVL
jgi:hypothetical protein